MVKDFAKLDSADNRGFSLIETMTAIGISSIVVFAIISSLVYVLKLQNSVDAKLAMQQIRDQVYWTLMDEVAWINTVNDTDNSANLSCLKTPPYDCSGFIDPAGYSINQVIGPDLTVTDPIVFDSTSAGAGLERGFRLDGNKCVGNVAGDDTCPIRLSIVWYATSSGNRPMIIIRGTFTYKRSSSHFAVNPSKYNFTINKPGVVNTMPSNFSCPANEFIIGTNVDGTPVCGPYLAPPQPNTTCGNMGEAFIAIDANGLPVCGPLVYSATCGPGQFVDNITPDGSIICTDLPTKNQTGCPDDLSIIGYDAFGEPKCGLAVDSMTCPAGQIISGFSSSGGIICTDGTLGTNACNYAVYTCPGSCVASGPADCNPPDCPTGVGWVDLGVSCPSMGCTYMGTCTSAHGGGNYSCKKSGSKKLCYRRCRFCNF